MTGFLIEGITYANLFRRIINALPEDERESTLFFVRDIPSFNYIKEHLPSATLHLLPLYVKVPEHDEFSVAKPIIYRRINEDINSSFEYVIGRAEYDLCWRYYFSAMLFITNIMKSQKITKLIMCSGCGLWSKAATLVCNMQGISTRYIELSNLPDKIFIDPLGTNARSRLAHSPEILDAYDDVDEGVHQRWMKTYKKFKQKVPPQAQQNPLSTAIAGLATDRILQHASPYLFLPLQVSNDAQLWLSSRCKNSEAIRHAQQRAEADGLRLVVKIHPAEMSSGEIAEVAQLRERWGFAVSNENTVDLVQGAKGIVTINSTVGLEGLLYDKPVEILGDCFYKHFDQARLRKYIHHYLFSPINFFGKEGVDRATAKAFMAK